MSQRAHGHHSWRFRGRFISSGISTTLVLYALGLLALLLINVHRLSTYVRENLSVSVVLKEDVQYVDAEFLRKSLDASSYVKSSQFISKEQAAEELKGSLGQDFLALLQYNPLSPSIELRLRAEWANTDSIRAMAEELLEAPQVSDVRWEANLVDAVNNNVRKISLLFLAFSAVMTFIAVVLINNTIRISVYARRFIIKTMQLVGAKPSFVRAPFMHRSLRHGVMASILAIAMVLGTVGLIQGEFYELVNLHQFDVLSIVSGFIIISGLVLNGLTTYLAVNKYLTLGLNELYY